MLLASWLWQAWRGPAAPRPLPAGKLAVALPFFDDDGVAEGPQSAMRLAYWRWRPANPIDSAAPVLLLHGSPGTADELVDLGQQLAAGGFEVFALDLPGFGDSTRDVPRYSNLAHTRAVLSFMDALGLRRAHAIGWSMSGGVVLHLEQLARDRVASITLLGAIGDERYEGSGSHVFEHGKYAVGHAVLLGAKYLIPHFGALGDFSIARSFIRNFRDTDMRPLRRLMPEVTTPTLILHGRRDFLVPRRAAESHHELIRPSELVVTRYGHFMPLAPPFGQAQATAEHLRGFLARVEGALFVRREVDLAPEPPWFLGRAGSWGAWLLVASPVWIVLPALALAAWRYPRVSVLVAALLIFALLLDPFVAITGLSLGTLARWWRPLGAAVPVPWEPTRARSPGRIALAALGSLGRAVLMLIAALTLTSTIVQPLGESFMAPGLLLGMAPALLALWLLANVFTRSGRWQVGTAWRRWKHHEFWPAWVFYLPLLPWVAWLALRHGPLAFLKANPAIHKGGGWVNESKGLINATVLRVSDRMLFTGVIEPGELASRVRRLDELQASHPELAYPVILKPDAGQRGFGVRVARSRADAQAYLASMTRTVVAQQYHPGPNECGILWIRREQTLAHNAAAASKPNAPEGFIFAVTRKTFPVVEGDGRRTLQDLILTHPRLRCQAAVFLARPAVAAQRQRVLAAGERLRLAEAGNHCQGTLFSDGMDLVTPALEHAIDAIARDLGKAERGAPGLGGFDFGRFDIRYESDDALARGEGFGIVELNGTSSEATSLYDPAKGPLFAYRLLFGQWGRLFRLGAARGRLGSPGLTWSQVWREMRDHYTDRPGDPVSD